MALLWVVRIYTKTTLFVPDRMPGKIAACAKRGLTAGKVPADLKAEKGCDGIGKTGRRKYHQEHQNK
jgi:hypothetical protein